MQVSLTGHTFAPEFVVASAAWDCTHTTPLSKEYDYGKLIRNIINRGHFSPLEFADFSFKITGVSRATTAQLTRHRIASYAQQSQRYNTYTNGLGIVIPPSIQDEALRARFKKLSEATIDFYKELIAEGIPSEDARFIIPIGAESVINVKMNARTLKEFFALRCCLKTQWELRSIADQMLMIVRTLAPNIFEGLATPCGEKLECVGCARCPKVKVNPSV